MRPGDLLLRGSLAYGFDLIDAMTGEVLLSAARSVTDLVDAARRLGRRDLWRQHVDGNGEALGEPFRLGFVAPITDL